MDIAFTDDDRSFQKEVADWLSQAWPQDIRDKHAKSALGKLSKEFKVSLIINSEPSEQLKVYLKKYDICYFILDDYKSYSEYYFCRKYFFKDYSTNVALKEKHVRSIFCHMIGEI